MADPLQPPTRNRPMAAYIGASPVGVHSNNLGSALVRDVKVNGVNTRPGGPTTGLIARPKKSLMSTSERNANIRLAARV